MNTQTRPISKAPMPPVESHAFLHCPICTHTVDGTVVTTGRQTKVKPGQKCPRCSAALDPAYIVRLDRAA